MGRFQAALCCEHNVLLCFAHGLSDLGADLGVGLGADLLGGRG